MKYEGDWTRRTKIVCTIGPASGSMGMIRQLINAGMNVARLNLSHGTHRDHSGYVERIRKLGQRPGTNIAVLIDLPGPKYRTGKLKRGKAVLKEEAKVVLTTRQVEGDAALVPVNIPHLPKEIRVGDTVLIDDGAIQIRVLSKVGTEIRCRVIVGGVLTSGRGLVVPGMRRSGPYVTDALKQHLLFAIREQPDYLALSFVSSADDINQVRAIVKASGADIPIIAKIERGIAVDNFDSILNASDGIMVARGDLGVDIPLEKVPMVQKEIIRKCNKVGKPVITATQMLESMVTNFSPTRAEVTDVANAIFDGTDATMLSAETSVGKYPVQAVNIMAKIALEIETELPYDKMLEEKRSWLEYKIEELISYNACLTAQSLGAAAIVAFTHSGSTAVRVSKFRPGVPILSLSSSDVVCGRVLLWWGVYPVKIAEPASISGLFTAAADIARKLGLARKGDIIVITGGIPVGVPGSTNLLKVEEVS
ncbi:pyruvate kinase [Chloroflexota bacterium]